MSIKLERFAFVFCVALIVFVKTTLSWKYQTKCTKVSATKWSSSGSGATIDSSINNNTALFSISSPITKTADSYSIVDDFERMYESESPLAAAVALAGSNQERSSSGSGSKQMRLKCPNSNDFLFIGLTQYGVSQKNKGQGKTNEDDCEISPNDCLVNVDYLANECNGLNSCDIQLDAQFLHSCKNLSDYLSVAYECIPGSKRIDVCSNEENFIIDSSGGSETNSNDLTSRFGSFFLSSPNYPNEYSSNLNNCSCRLEYVQLEDSSSGQANSLTQYDQSDKMNLVLKTYEFDVEESESSELNDCSKDRLQMESLNSPTVDSSTSSHSISLCGQYKDFKEFYLSGSSVRLNFSSDDAITRRGFLIEIAPTSETVCPFGTERFNSKKCIKYYGGESDWLNWHEATESCQAKSGRLLTITDFVDNLKLNSFLRTQFDSIGVDSTTIAVWSTFATKTKSKSKSEFNFLNLKRDGEAKSSKGCMSKRANYWQDESCNVRLPYICELDALNINPKPSSNNQQSTRNRLIRFSCGSMSSIFTSTTTIASSTTPSTPSSTTSTKLFKKVETKLVTGNDESQASMLSWSSLIEQARLKQTKQPVIQSTSTSTKTSATVSNLLSDLFSPPSTSSEANNQNYRLLEEDDVDDQQNKMSPVAEHLNNKNSIVLKQLKQESNSASTQMPSKQTAASSSQPTKSIISQELALIIAVVSGVSAVFIVVNIFCIWNYYNKKLKAFIKKGEANMESNYRTSTMISRSKMSNTTTTTSTNNRSMSTVDSYVKVAPSYETCLNTNLLVDQMTLPETARVSDLFSTNESADSTTTLLTNQLKLSEYLRAYYPVKPTTIDQQNSTPNYYETISSRNYSLLAAQNPNSIGVSSGYVSSKMCSLSDCNCNMGEQQQQHQRVKQFDSIVVLPSGASVPSSTVVLLSSSSQNQHHHHQQQHHLQQQLMSHQQQQQQQNNSTSITFNDVSPSSISSTKPLITFSNSNSNHQPSAI